VFDVKLELGLAILTSFSVKSEQPKMVSFTVSLTE